MTELEKLRDSDAPLAAARHKGDVGDELAEELDWPDAVAIGRSVTINRPRRDLYAFWRDFSNLPRFMVNVDRVECADATHSHWVVRAPNDKTVEWDSVVTEDTPDELIAWESTEGGDIRNEGRIEFRDGPPERGTIVTATIIYDPPGGQLGRVIAKLFGKEPKVQARRELRRFKQLMETGEVATAEAPDAAPRGER